MVWPIMALALDSSDVAVLLALEGVPLRAIARATRTPSEELRAQLQAARSDGRLLELPQHDDWPAGFPRSERALRLSRLVVENKGALLLAIQDIFRLTPAESGILLLLLQHEKLCRSRLEHDSNVLAVHILNMRRRLRVHGLAIQAIYGFGYQLPVEHRHKAMDIILRQTAALPVD
jgi:DNA-binding response OmpR family regulator